ADRWRPARSRACSPTRGRRRRATCRCWRRPAFSGTSAAGGCASTESTSSDSSWSATGSPGFRELPEETTKEDPIQRKTKKVRKSTPLRKAARTRARGLASKGRGPRADVPQFFRLNVEVGNLDEAVAFYSKLLGIEGRRQPGSRCYFEAGPVTLQVLDV